MGRPRFEEHDLGLSWLADRGELMQRASHCVRLGDGGGKVWVIDPVDAPGVDERIATVAGGEGVAGVLQLLDRHERDCGAFAERLGAPLHRLPFTGIEGSGLEPVKVLDRRFWREVAIHSPADRALIVPEAVGTARYFRAGDEAVGVHPMLRALPPRRLAELEPIHLLTGHGTGIHGPATAAALADALAASRRRIPLAIVSMVRARG
ncbi:MAG: hypothetical protein KJ006_03880 [Thermoleophilia bacterium]|nr:hypothetical protein [Thermoleophilia bacterium]